MANGLVLRLVAWVRSCLHRKSESVTMRPDAAANDAFDFCVLFGRPHASSLSLDRPLRAPHGNISK